MKIKISILGFLFLVFFSTRTNGQEYKMNHASLELAGVGKNASLNYERFLFKNDLSISLGYGLIALNDATINASLNYYFKSKSEGRFWQVGLGGTYSNEDLTDVVGNQRPEPYYLYLVPKLGHRWKTKKNYTFQLSLTPFIRKDEVFPWGGISFGKQF